MLDLMEKHCPVCGKEFYPGPEWTWKDSKHVYCSYKCYRSVIKKKIEKHNRRKRKKVNQYSIDGVFIQTFPNVEVAADHVFGTSAGVGLACCRHKKYKGYLWEYVK